MFYSDCKPLSTCKLKVSWKLPEQLDCFISNAMKSSSKTLTNPAEQRGCDTQLLHTSWPPKQLKKPRQTETWESSKNEHTLRCKCNCWSVCVNRKRKKISGSKSHWEGPELLGAQNCQEKTSRQDKFSALWFFIHRNKTLPSWKGWGEGNKRHKEKTKHPSFHQRTVWLTHCQYLLPCMFCGGFTCSTDVAVC